jgi:hypothetical protein
LDVLRQSEKRLFEIRRNMDGQDRPGHPASDPTQLEKKWFWFGPADRRRRRDAEHQSSVSSQLAVATKLRLNKSFQSLAVKEIEKL